MLQDERSAHSGVRSRVLRSGRCPRQLPCSSLVSRFGSGEGISQIIKHAVKKNHEIIIFDDGLQERGIDYDLKFVCFDSKIWLGNGYLIPSGPLRETIKSLKRYDCVFLKITDGNTNLINILALKEFMSTESLDISHMTTI